MKLTPCFLFAGAMFVACDAPEPGHELLLPIAEVEPRRTPRSV